jgi:hypothetical protein
MEGKQRKEHISTCQHCLDAWMHGISGRYMHRFAYAHAGIVYVHTGKCSRGKCRLLRHANVQNCTIGWLGFGKRDPRLNEITQVCVTGIG